jgi:hypothetical protein
MWKLFCATEGQEEEEEEEEEEEGRQEQWERYCRITYASTVESHFPCQNATRLRAASATASRLHLLAPAQSMLLRHRCVFVPQSRPLHPRPFSASLRASPLPWPDAYSAKSFVVCACCPRVDFQWICARALAHHALVCAGTCRCHSRAPRSTTPSWMGVSSAASSLQFAAQIV